MNETINLLKSHRSIRKFKDNPVEPEKLQAIIESAQAASSSSFLQPYTIIGVKEPSLKEELARLSGDQPYVARAPLFLVFCADLNHIDQACRMNAIEMPKDYTETFIIAAVDTALAAQNAMVAAESLGLGGVYIGGLRNDPRGVCNLLKIPKHAFPLFGICLGYPDQSPEVKPRLPQAIIYRENYYNSLDERSAIDEYDETVSQYYLTRTRGKRADRWSQQMAEKFSKELRPHMEDFLKEQGFKMK